ncbi:MAG TPA: tRNA preQ1(34) S-adenosylmethionine ribosyltransferase-isomerase QueA, partial [Candidatus Polarisedimenticolia bacterium]|nr:tRNA preQ1(34) S-adenosylmethionine ribosyltransferase-isomerase QueA [Candidatus Polarisedimenticolia bacterium]
RDASRLLVVERSTGRLEHRVFRQLADLLDPGDLLVFNDTRVFRARVIGRKPTGGALEFLFVRPSGDRIWETLCNGTRELRDGMLVRFAEEMEARVAGRKEASTLLEFPPGQDVEAFLDRCGEVPLPPYLHPGARSSPGTESASERYQTIYARSRGAVAAPTAGLHFTRELFARLDEKKIRRVFLTLHVGPGTFLPVRSEDARQHRVPGERFDLPGETAKAVASTRREGGRVVAVGTTVARVLEHVARRSTWEAARGECDLTLLPGDEFRCVDALITNFHLPRTTLLLLVAAFAGRERILEAYCQALERGYRFYSYGDAMLLI